MKNKGVNLGGWLLMEGYILGGRNIAESEMKRQFSLVNGNTELIEFEKAFRDNFITGSDFRNIRLMGANTVRLPFNHKLLEKQPYGHEDNGFHYLDNAFKWAAENKLRIILDLHAACGSQNCDWHSDSSGTAQLWEDEDFRRRTYVLWGKIADRYRFCGSLLGYDILNEPVIDESRIAILKDFYSNAIKSIRLSDKTHTIFLEGNMWGQQIDFLADLLDENISVSVHNYNPLNYTFNFVPCTRYPGRVDKSAWNKNTIRRYLNRYRKFSNISKTSIFVGEFGINWRGGHFGELNWLNDTLNVYDDYGFDYTYWTYKAVAGPAFPDGIYQYFGNNDYIKREGPVYGFENYANRWKSEKHRIADFFKTSNYTPNKAIIKVLKKHFLKS